jgi:aryl-alcohol dehydrogenase-like predicted oxidoreductase
MSSETHELLSDLVQRQRVSHVGVSATSFEEVKAALSIPAVTMLQVPSAVARALSETALIDRLRERDMALFAREILRKSESGQNEGWPAEALAAALAPPFVTAAVVGVSSRAHLNDFLPVVS